MNDNDLRYETQPSELDIRVMGMLIDTYSVPQLLELVVDHCAERADRAKAAGCSAKAAVWNRYVNRIEAAIVTIAA